MITCNCIGGRMARGRRKKEEKVAGKKVEKKTETVTRKVARGLIGEVVGRNVLGQELIREN